MSFVPVQTPNLGMAPNLGIAPNLGMAPNLGIAPNLGMAPGLGMAPNLGIAPNLGMAPGLGMAPNLGMPATTPMGIPYGQQVAKVGEGIVTIFNSRAMSFFLLAISIIIIFSMLKGFIFHVANLFGTAVSDTWTYTIDSIQKNLL